MRRMHHMAICSEGAYYLVVMAFILTAALIRQINLLMVLYGLLAGPLLISWWLVRRQVNRVEIVRHAPKSAIAGEPFAVEVELVNKRKRGGSFSLMVRDELQRRGRDGKKNPTTEVYCGYLPGGETQRVSYQGRLARRGLYDFQPLRLSSRFPMGLLRTTLRFEQPQRLLVLPRQGHLTPAWQRLLRSDGGDGVGGRRQTGFQEGDFYGLRDWRPGDPRNRIHWRTSARRGSLTVRQYERRRQSDLLLIVQLWEPEKPTDADRARNETIVSFAATVMAEASQDGGRAIHLEIVGKKPRRIKGTASPRLLDEAMTALATTEAASGDALPSALVTALSELHPQASGFIVGARPIDLFDRTRFAPLWQRTDLQLWPARLVSLHPADARWKEIFQEATP